MIQSVLTRFSQASTNPCAGLPITRPRSPIDENHQIIFSRIRAIVDARNSASKEKLGEMLAQLGDETAEHFDAEERVMAEHRYEFAALHREEHRKLLEEFACQVEDFRNDVISVELMCRFVYG